MKLPSYIFVCASTLIPAFVRIGQLPSLLVPLKTLPKVGRAMKHVQGKVGSTPFKDTDVVLEEKRKHFLVTYFKSEVGALPEVSCLLFRRETMKLRFRCKTKILKTPVSEAPSPQVTCLPSCTSECHFILVHLCDRLNLLWNDGSIRGGRNKNEWKHV